MTSRADTVDALRSALTSFGVTARRLTAEQWTAPSLCPGWSARDVVVHVATIESAMVGWHPDDTNPFDAMGAIARELSGLDDAVLLARYDTVAAERSRELSQLTDQEFDRPSITPVGQGTYGRFLQIRVFDVWVHERDVRVPLGLDGDDGGPVAAVALDEVRSSLGYIMGKKVGLPDGAGIVIELTGPVEARMCVQVDGRAREVEELESPTVTLTTDSLTFMLLACGRIDPEGPIADGRVRWTGDDALGGRAARNLAFTM
jgi:uncharacterized protein (TIGR03083 family)